MARSPPVPAELGKRVREIVQRHDKIGFERQRLFESTDGLFAAAERRQHIADVVVGLRQAGVQRQHLGIPRQRLLRTVQLGKCVAEIGVGLGGIRTKGHRPFKLR